MKSKAEVPQMTPSVQPAWCLSLPIQQQSVLMLGARGPDGIAKAHPCKRVQRAYRGTVLVAAKWGRLLEWGERADTFMSLDEFADEAIWDAIVKDFFQHADDLPHHFYMHLIHGAEIISYKHPDGRFRARWGAFYNLCVREFHFMPETMAEMDARLSDWQRVHWSPCLSENAPKSSDGSGFPKSGSSSPGTVREQMEGWSENPEQIKEAIRSETDVWMRQIGGITWLRVDAKADLAKALNFDIFEYWIGTDYPKLAASADPQYPMFMRPKLREILSAARKRNGYSVPSGIVEQPKKETDLGEKEA